MPHCVLEYSANVADEPDWARLLLDLHEVLAGTGLFSRNDVKSRVVRHELFAVGDGAADRAFVALDLRILGGRSDEVKAALSEAALALLVRAFPRTLAERRASLTVEVSELHRPSYRRHVAGV